MRLSHPARVERFGKAIRGKESSWDGKGLSSLEQRGVRTRAMQGEKKAWCSANVKRGKKIWEEKERRRKKKKKCKDRTLLYKAARNPTNLSQKFLGGGARGGNKRGSQKIQGLNSLAESALAGTGLKEKETENESAGDKKQGKNW